MTDLLLFCAGILVGAMNAIAGGGMLIGFPVLLATGLSPLVANVTTHIIVLPGALSSAYGYRKYIRKLPRKYLLLMAPCLAGATIGAIILRNTSTERFQDLVPALLLFAVVLFAFQPLLHFHLNRHLHGHIKGFGTLSLIALALLPVAVYGGYFGVGFGFIMLAFLGFTKLHDIHQMNGLKNLAVFCIAIASLVCLYDTGLINWHHGLVMAAGCTVGGYCGSRLAQKVSSHFIRIIVIAIGFTTAIYLALRTY